MADFPHFTKLLHFRSPSLSSPLFFPLHHHRRLSLLRRLSLSTAHLSSSPNLLLLSSSLESDGSVVFKFGDASELPPDTTSSDDEGIAVENDGNLVAVDRLHSVEDDIEDSIVEDVDSSDTTSSSFVGVGIEMISEIESDEIAKDDEHNHDDVVVTSSEVEDYAAAPSVNHNSAVDDQIVVETKIESNEIAKDDDIVMTASVLEDSAGAPSLNDDDAVAISDDGLGLDDRKIEVENLDSTSEVALEEDTEVADNDSVKGTVVEHNDDDDEIDELVELPIVQLAAEPILDEEVSLPSTGVMEDPATGDHADEAFPSLVNSAVTSTESNVDRALSSEEITTDSGDISASSFSVPSTSASHSTPSMVNDALPSVVESDNCTESKDISEPTGPDLGLDSNSFGTVSAEANPDSRDSVQIPTVAVSTPSASLDKEVRDATTLSIQQSDDIYVAADPGPGIIATTEISLREEISAPSLCLVSAAASLAHSAEALAGRDDAYFVCENWFGVADGVGQWSFGGINRGLYAQEFIRNCENLATKSLNTGLNGFKELFQQSAAMTESPGAARVLIAHVAEQVLHVANIGDAGFIIIRNGTVFMKSSPMFHEFNFPLAVSSDDNPLEAAEEYHVELKDGDIIVTATDGLFDNLYEHEIVSLVGEALEDEKNVKDIAELLAFRSQEVGRSPDAQTPFADAAQAAGHTEISGGKFDHVTVIVSAVKMQ